VVRHRHIRGTSTVGADRTFPWLGRGGKNVGQQFGWLSSAGYLGRGRRSGRRPDDQIGHGHVRPGIEQAGDDADLPRIACRSATMEDQRSSGRGGRPPGGVDLLLILLGPLPFAMPRRIDGGGREPIAGFVARPFIRYCPEILGDGPRNVVVQVAAVAYQEKVRAGTRCRAEVQSRGW